MGMTRALPVGSTSINVTVAMRSSSTGQLLGSLAYGSVTYSYWRDGAAVGATATCSTATKGTWASGGWVESDYAGMYQFGIPNACLAAGANGCKIKLVATGALDVVIDIQLISATAGFSGTDQAAIKAKTDTYPFTISPLTSTVSAGAVSDNKLTAYQNHALGTYVWTITDDDHVAVNLDGKTVKAIFGKIGSESSPLFTYSSTGSEIVVSSTDHNVVTLLADDTNTGTAGLYQYRLINATDDTVLNTGTLKIIPGVATT